MEKVVIFLSMWKLILAVTIHDFLFRNNIFLRIIFEIMASYKSRFFQKST